MKIYFHCLFTGSQIKYSMSKCILNIPFQRWHKLWVRLKPYNLFYAKLIIHRRLFAYIRAYVKHSGRFDIPTWE